MPTLKAPPAQFDLPALEEGILRLWADNDVEGRSLRQGAAAARGQGDRPAFAFNDGPPFATGLPHYGHLLPGTIKDIVPRYQTMCGFAVERRFGWDCHGLPIESLVEEQLGIHGQAEVEAYGIDRFNAACRAGVLRFTKEWETMVRRTGRWVDFANDYKTMDPSFMETVWWVFRRLWDDGSIYEGFRVQPVSPALGTPLSNFEVAQGPQEKDPVTRKEGHKRVSDPSVTIRFALEDEEGASLWAWTTTPWTLPSNLALAVHPDVIYVKVRVVETGEIAYLEPGRLADYQARGRVGQTEELARMPGRDLVGRPYAPLLPFFAQHREGPDGQRRAFKVVAAEYVTVDSGTGIVHQAPAFGEDDYEVGRREGLPMVRPMGLAGVFDDSVGEFAGLFAKDADKPIIQRLKAEGKLVDQDVIVHPYPHCYRTDQPLLYMALSTWFMKVEDMRDQLVALNDQIHWVPEHVGSGRFGNWLASARDWNLARNRFWGTPLPIWRCDEDPSDMVCIGSIRELEELAGMEPGTITDLHRESIDPITFPSRKTKGGTMRRVSEVFDCWFESGSMPYAQNHYPFDETRKQYVEDKLPADFIAEGLDQTRGWFYTLHVLAAALFGRLAFKHVIVNGLVLAEDGKKMSKRLKNYPDPGEIIHQYGADALRAYLINSAAVRAEPMRFAERGVRDTVRKIVLPLQNAYNFLATYAQADGWEPSLDTLEHKPQTPLDRWILSRLQDFVGQMRAELSAYALSNLVPAFHRICDDLNNWYIRRGRRRYWRGQGEDDRDKTDAYATLFQALSTITHAIAPVIPFFSEWMYQRLWVDTGLAGEGEDSVHLRPYPKVHDGWRDEALEADVAAVRQVANLGMAIRERERLAVRRPLATMTVASPDPRVRAAVEAGRDDLLGELNVKELRVVEDDGGLVRLSAKANFKTLGKRLGKRMKEVAAAVAGLDGAAIRAYLSTGSVEVAGETLGTDDVLVVREVVGQQAAEAAEGITVLLDTAVTDALRLEGLAREIINRVQNLRKATGLEVSDRIALTLSCGGELAEAAQDPELAEMIKGETLAQSLTVAAPQGTEAQGSDESFEIDGETLVVALRRQG
ncbi:MAG: isoleucine--tRNA ligase [Myxococcales bacterium]|nr:isoleucine--tRNA ligase [Myxococcales bacterium]MCB9716495.1 isoleucine--tRNA ligase [Myxococcales bacterium]